MLVGYKFVQVVNLLKQGALSLLAAMPSNHTIFLGPLGVLIHNVFVLKFYFTLSCWFIG